MEDCYRGLGKEVESMELPPGFRFHPTDEELITHYLSPKVNDSSFDARAIGEVDLNKVEPWDLPRKAKMGEKDWYFFCVRDRKYPTGLRTNRATQAGYWKATGKDREIYRAKSLIGMKKTLVFYTGRAPKGEKTNWVMHEYRLEGKILKYNLPKTPKNEWVICRVFKKSSGGKTTHTSVPARLSSYGDELQPSFLPPLMESSETKAPMSNASYVTCFSRLLDNNQSPFGSDYNAPPSALAASPSSSQFMKYSVDPHTEHHLLYTDSSLLTQQDHSIMKLLLEGNGSNLTTRSSKAELSQDTGLSGDLNTDMSSAVSRHEMLHEIPSTIAATPIDLDCLLNY
ncbi:hypothetical protein Nepgr_006956 [Nepenthes gracilis]|uniref:NAC domain-containing protein n=1 Tax=Nepenthes gracilis TaxID=150966 RepID=A0AAD3XI29_NEPGR|nr:hypothetical protein Nepgr_006956 [Nepenthes gracilis]